MAIGWLALSYRASDGRNLLAAFEYGIEHGGAVELRLGDEEYAKLNKEKPHFEGWGHEGINMCGRYVRRSDKQRVAEAFHLGKLPEGFVLPPDFNIAPSTFQPVIRLNRETGEREMVMMRWGLIPHFAKSLADFKGLSNINVKAETIKQRAMWRIPFQKRRCLVPADGFYEWQKIDAKTKKPYFYSLNNGKPFGLAALWDAWKDPSNNEWLLSFAIITTEPNELTAQVHDRMPVILQPRDYDRLLKRGAIEELPTDLLKPFPAEDMKAQEANAAVGNVRNNGPEMLECSDW